jgi:hypothetical protein
LNNSGYAKKKEERVREEGREEEDGMGREEEAKGREEQGEIELRMERRTRE